MESVIGNSVSSYIQKGDDVGLASNSVVPVSWVVSSIGALVVIIPFSVLVAPKIS